MKLDIRARYNILKIVHHKVYNDSSNNSLTSPNIHTGKNDATDADIWV